MLVDRWDIAHICIAVDDLEAAMARYGTALGLEWGPVLNFSSRGLVVSPTETIEMPAAAAGPDDAVSMEGLREVWAINGALLGVDGPSTPAMQLTCARPSSPAFALWGCPPGQEYVHHVCYWVDDIEAESRHLVANGFTVEFPRPRGVVNREFAYLRSPGGFRIELADRVNKPVIAQWFTSGARPERTDLGV
jgi:catechol 2,3-dioxygenase-like lactoylglutathione lyase family enzyme